MGRKKPTGAAATAAEEVEGDPPVAAKKKNKKKGAFVVDDDEYMAVELDDDNSLRSSQKHGAVNGKAAAEEVDEGPPLPMEEDQKKGASAVDNGEYKKGNKSGRAVPEQEDARTILAELEASRKPTPDVYQSDPANSELVHTGPEHAVDFSGSKKKKKKKGKDVQEQQDVYAILAEIEKPDEQKQDTFHSGQENAVEFSQAIPEVEDLEAEMLEFAGSKKKKKKKGKEAQEEQDAHSTLADIEGADERKQDAFHSVPENAVVFSQAVPEVVDFQAEMTVEFSGSKKKNKKKGKEAQEEHDAHLTLAETGGAGELKHDFFHSVLENTVDFSQTTPEVEDLEAETMAEFAGSKKKQKKKEKEAKEQQDVYSVLAEIEGADEQKQDPFHSLPENTVEFPQVIPEVECFKAETAVEFAGSKKKKKKKDKEAGELQDAYSILAEIEGADEWKQDAFHSVPDNTVDFSQVIPEVEDFETEVEGFEAETVVEFAGSKKKKKKKDKEAREQQDVYSILAEIEGADEWNQDAFQSVPDNTVDFSQVLPEVEDFETETMVEFAASKKQKKKKDKESHEQKDVYSILAEIEGADERKLDTFHSVPENTVDFPQVTPEVEDFEAEMMVEFAGSKKKKKKKDKEAQEQQDVFSILTEIEGADEQKQDSFHSVPEDTVDLTQVIQETEDFEAEKMEYAGSKKKQKKKGKETREQEDAYAILTELEWQEELESNVSQNATKPVHSGSEPEDLEIGKLVEFAGSKKKKKKGKEVTKEEQDLDAIVAELGGPKAMKTNGAIPTEPVQGLLKPVSEDTVECPGPESLEDLLPSSKAKSKKGKKSGRTAQEEEDLEAILAELEGSKVVKPDEAILVESIQAVSNLMSVAAIESSQVTIAQENLEAEEAFESAAAKKKKKKKEKEKEKAKAAAERAPAKEVMEEKVETSKGKAPEKKVPKHVREMQERLAKQKEQEEKRRLEEEEKHRKEEEEQRRLEELERQKEEAKRRRKEREKEKLLKKKQEGKLLTGKQKEEAKRLALMREQLLAQRGISVDSDISVKEDAIVAPKKPKYENKKKRRPHRADIVPFEENVDIEQEDQMITSHEEGVMVVEPAIERDPEVEKFEEVQIEEEVGEEDEVEDWDAKSWDDEVALPAIKSSFAEEEESAAGPKLVAKRIVGPPPLPKRPVSLVKSTSEIKPTTEKETKPAQVKTQQSNGEAGSEDESDSDDEDVETKRHRGATLKREARTAEALTKRSADDLRSPICCILGHVDTGKTKLLDCIRRTNVQEGEAGGITQQIGATYFPMENIRERTKELKAEASLKVPGLLVIDTPGHESFTNLRVRGSGLCDIAILVIDIMHGLEPQTIESLNLLKMRHTPFVVALNKVDRLYAWKPCLNSPIRAVLKLQSKDVVNEFEMRVNQIVNQLKEQGLNSELYFRNKEVRKYVSIVPTSAISGEGVPDLLMLLIQLTQKMMAEKLMYISEVQCSVLEVKVIEGLGTTIDVILVNGVLHEGDQIVVCGMQGPIVTTIRALLTPHPMKELRVKGSYQHHKELKAAQGIKITAQGLEHAIAGTQLYVVGPDDDLEDVKEEAMQDMKNVMSRIDKSGEGVCVQSSTLGSLEALLEFLKSPAVKIPVSGISIGPVHKRDVMRASVMLERKRKEYATILAFDVKVTPEARDLAEELGVRIFMADIIYHLFDQFTAYMNNIKEEKKKEVADEAVFPCVLKIMPECIFNKKDPIILGVDVLEGVARVGTPLCVPSRDGVDIGRIVSMEVNHKVLESAKKGQNVAMKIIGTNTEENQKMFGRHFDLEDELVSHITRRSIDVLKESYRDELSMDEWRLLVKLKKLFEIP